MDEVILRTKATSDENGDIGMLVLSFCVIMQRGSSQLLILPLPDKIVEAGGGGPIRDKDLFDIMAMETDPANAKKITKCRLLPGSIVHTDAARAYFNIGSSQLQPDAGEKGKIDPSDPQFADGRPKRGWTSETDEQRKEREAVEAEQELWADGRRNPDWARC